MALIPLKQNVTVRRSGEFEQTLAVTSVTTVVEKYDEWGQPVYYIEVTLKARVTEETKVIKTSTGEEAVTSLRIIFDKLQGISYNDIITYKDELGVTVSRSPLSIEVKRGLSGKALLTEVYV